jgi:cyclic beta-1,2-glucan synthetase
VRLDDEISIYEHCTRAIARTMPTGTQGLPLMGTGDWNDGMDEVGRAGAGARASGSAGFSPHCSDRSQRMPTRAATRSWRVLTGRTRRGSKDAAEAAWDGAWYRRRVL